jgi:hypothetical protein
MEMLVVAVIGLLMIGAPIAVVVLLVIFLTRQKRPHD